MTSACPRCHAPLPILIEVRTDPERAIDSFTGMTLHCECYRCHAYIDLTMALGSSETKGKVLQ